MKSLKETKVYSINDFINWHENGELILSPKYQRKGVWNDKANSYLIDTIVRGLPIPQVFIRQTIDTQLRKTHREVIDGQQRLRAILKFVNNEFSVMKLHNKELGGKQFRDLDEEEKYAFLDYQIPVELIKTDDDNIVYDMFMRVNTNSITLNKQELRNAKYWGDLKVLAYKLASEWRQFFDDNKVFRDNDFIRMNDVEFVSTLLRLMKDGVVNDTSTNLDSFYKNNEYMEDGENIEKLFNDIFKDVDELFMRNTFYTRYFNKKNYLYTLVSYFLLKKTGIPNYNSIDIIGAIDLNLLENKLQELESSMDIPEEDRNKVINEFMSHHKTRTTNEIERKQRIKILCDFLEKE